MLTIMFPLMLLLLIKPKWNSSMMFMASIIAPATTIILSTPLPLNFNTYFGMDFMSMMLIILTLWIAPMIIAASQNIFKNALSAPSFIFYATSLTAILILCFTASHLFLFYVLFEASLIPTLLIIIKWGYQPERLQAGLYLMLYTITASLPLLIGISFFSLNVSSYNPFFVMWSFCSPLSAVWVVMNLAFMVKLPLFLFHLWLPKAHVEAPVAGSMILAAILLKLGGYGMLRMVYMINPIMSETKMYIMALSLWGGMITSIICVRQQDMKSLIAYSSVGHMSLVMAGILSNIPWGIWGAMAMMVSHGLLSSALFASADMCYSMSNSRSLLLNKGLNITLPTMSMLWFIMCAANMAAPPSCNLMAEIMLISCSTVASKFMLAPLSVMSFTAAAYSLTLYVSMNHGPLNSLNSASSYIDPRNLLIIMGHVLPLVSVMAMPILIVVW